MAKPTLKDVEAWESEAEKPKAANQPITLQQLDEWDKEAESQESPNPLLETQDKIAGALLHPATGERLQDVGKGFAQSAANAPGALVNMIRPGTVPQFNFAPKSQGAEEGNFLFNMIAPAKVGKGLSAAGKIAELVPGINKLFGSIRNGAQANRLLAGAGQVAKSGAEGAVGGAITDPEHAQESALTGGILGAGLRGAGKAIGAGLNAINPFKTNLSPQQLQQNLRAAEGTQTPLGDVLESPTLKKFLENIVAPIPGSGVQDKLQNLSRQITDRGHAFMEHLRGGIEPVEINDRVIHSLKGALKETKRIKNNLYGKLDKEAEKTNFKPSVSNFMQEAKRSRNSIDSIKVLENDPDLKSLYNKITRYEEPLAAKTAQSPIVNQQGVPFTKHIPGHKPSLKEATLLKSTLSEYGKAFQASSDPKDRLAAGTLKRLAAKLDLDIKQSMKNAPANLQDMYKKTNNYFKEKFLPNLDSEIYKFTMGKGDPDMLVKSLVRSDRNKLSDKLLGKLSQGDKNLIGYSILKKAIDPETGAVNPKQLRSALRKLSSYQKEAIFGRNMSNSLNRYSRLIKMNDEALTQMHNPKTGARAMNYFGLGIPYAAGSSVGGVPGGIMAAAGASAGSNMLGSALTSPNMRRYAVNALSNPRSGLHNRLQRGIGASSAYAAPRFRNFLATGNE